MDIDGTAAAGMLDSLTAGQVAVLALVVRHMTSKQIARELGIAASTVDQRVKALFAKLGVADRASAARRLIELNEICGRTIYGSSEIDGAAGGRDSAPRELAAEQSGPVFFPKDSHGLHADGLFQVEHEPGMSRFLEVVDLRFGRLGRVGIVVAMSFALALLALVVTAIGAALSDLV